MAEEPKGRSRASSEPRAAQRSSMLHTSPTYLERPIWPLKDPSEALLFRHYVENLAIWVRSLTYTCRHISPAKQPAVAD
jgi:hypothetical protein